MKRKRVDEAKIAAVLSSSRVIRGVRVNFYELKAIIDDLISPESRRAGEICEIVREIERIWLKTPKMSFRKLVRSFLKRKMDDASFLEALLNWHDKKIKRKLRR